VKLYHAAISTCSQKVRLVLAEKGLGYESELLDLQRGDQFAPEYLARNPAGVVPTLEDRGGVYVESTLINEYLDDAYPDVPLRPLAPGLRHRMRLWCKRIDELHPHCGVVTYAIGVRPGLLKRPREEVDALIGSIPDPARRALRRSVVDDGVRSTAFSAAWEAHDRFFEGVEAALEKSPWLAGDLFSLADAALVPYVLRVDHLRLTGLIENRPRIMDWHERVAGRPSYEAAIESLLPETAVAAFGGAGEAVAAEVAVVVAALKRA
jgi:glutathione S-transferase